MDSETVGAGRNGEAIGAIETSTGRVSVLRADGERVDLGAGDPVYQGDEIVTGDDAAVSIAFVDGSVMSLGEDGAMVLDEMVYSPEDDLGTAAISVAKGVFVVTSGLIAKTQPDAMTVETPVMTIGIRGTKVAGRADAEGSDNAVSLMPEDGGVIGEITVATAAGVQVLNQLYQTIVAASAFVAPPPPVIVTPQSMGAIYGSTFDPVAGDIGAVVHGRAVQGNAPQGAPAPGGGDSGPDASGDGDAAGDTSPDIVAANVPDAADPAPGPALADLVAGLPPGIVDLIGAAFSGIPGFLPPGFAKKLEAITAEAISSGSDDDDDLVLVETNPSQTLRYGDETDNVIDGTNTKDVIVGFGGDDTLSGFAGNDTLDGGTGDDVLFGGTGNDRLDAGDGDDELVGNEGNDALFGGAGDDTLIGGTGNDAHTGGAGADTFTFAAQEGNNNTIVDFGIDDQIRFVDFGTGDIDIDDQGDTVIIEAGSGATRVRVTLESQDPGDSYSVDASGDDAIVTIDGPS